MYAQSVSALISKNVGNTLTNYTTWGGILYNVKDTAYGAKGDNLTDDTAAVQSAINAAIAKNDLFIYFPPGTYKVTVLTNTSQVYFLGDGATFNGISNIINQSWRGLFNDTSLTYGGGTSTVHIRNTEGQNTLTLRHSESNTLTTPFDTMRIYRDVSSQGGTTNQNGGAIVRSTIEAVCNHNEFGFMSVLNNYSTTPTAQNVSIYGQATSLTSASSSLWAGVFEVRNTTPTGGGTSVDHTLTGIEVDVSNAKAFNDTLKKIGVECIAYGGGESTEAFSVYAANNTRGDGVTYGTGHWRYGLRILANAIHETLGVGLQIVSTHGTGIEITGASANYAINLAANAATTTGLNIGVNYTNPIAIQTDKKIKFNGEANTQGISYVSANTAVTLDSAAIGVANHSTQVSATAGGTQAVPASVTGYLKIFVNGSEKRIPYFNI